MSKKPTIQRTRWFKKAGYGFFDKDDNVLCADGIRNLFCIPNARDLDIRLCVKTSEPKKRSDEWIGATIGPCDCGEHCGYYMAQFEFAGTRDTVPSWLAPLAKAIIGRRKRRKVWISCEYR